MTNRQKLALAKRTCLKCQKPFRSTGPANRICHTCQRKNTKLASPTYIPHPNRKTKEPNL